MLWIHSKVVVKEKIFVRGGKAISNTTVLHIVSDEGTRQKQIDELTAYINKMGISENSKRRVLSNPHITQAKTPHLDLWGLLASIAKRELKGKEAHFQDEKRRYLIAFRGTHGK